MSKFMEKFNSDVIDGVICSIKEKFRAENKPEDVIDTLKKMWIDKIKKSMYQKRTYQNAIKPILISYPTAYKKIDGNSDSEGENWEKVTFNEAKEAKKTAKAKEEPKSEKEKEQEKEKEKEEEKKKTEEPHVINEEQISSSSDDLLNEDGNLKNMDKLEANDIIFAQYEEVHRAKKKFKCKFLNVMMKLNIGDYVAPKATAEIDY